MTGPEAPRWLGYAGLVPQIAATVVAWLGPETWRAGATTGGALYAALILSFLGGTWWGLAASAPAAERRQVLGWVWSAGVLGSLLAAAALLPLALGWQWPEPSLVMLGGALLLSPIADIRLAQGGVAPRWWPRLRVPLSLGLGALTLAISFA